MSNTLKAPGYTTYRIINISDWIDPSVERIVSDINEGLILQDELEEVLAGDPCEAAHIYTNEHWVRLDGPDITLVFVRGPEEDVVVEVAADTEVTFTTRVLP